MNEGEIKEIQGETYILRVKEEIINSNHEAQRIAKLIQELKEEPRERRIFIGEQNTNPKIGPNGKTYQSKILYWENMNITPL